MMFDNVKNINDFKVSLLSESTYHIYLKSSKEFKRRF